MEEEAIEGRLGAGYLQDRGAAILPRAPPNMPRGRGGVRAASLEEMEPRILNQEPRLGQVMAIGWTPSLDLPDGGDLAEDVERLSIARTRIRFSCT